MTISGMAPPPCLPPWKWPPDWSRQAITSAAAAWGSGFHEWHLQRLSPAANPCHSRQPQYPQTQTPPLAAAPQTRPLPLHSHPRLVAQSDRDLVQYPQPTSAGSGQLPQRPTTLPQYRRLSRRLQPDRPSLRMEETSGVPETPPKHHTLTYAAKY